MSQPIRKLETTLRAVHSLGPGIGRVDLVGEGIGKGIQPGAFAMVEAPGRLDCILYRPYSYFCVPDDDTVSLLVRDVGKGTHALMVAPKGTPVGILGPLGNEFPLDKYEKIWAVAGGVGAAPFGMMTHHQGLTILFGCRTSADGGFAEALRAEGATVDLATDDGSAGYHDNAVQFLSEKLKEGDKPDAIFTCGPTPMMAAATQVAHDHNIPCFASLEERMGCGIGICRGCVQRDTQGEIICLCVDGPIYEAGRIFSVTSTEGAA